MFEITEKQLYKLKYENASKYKDDAMVNIFIGVCYQNDVSKEDFLELIKVFYHKYIDNYIHVLFPDSSFLLIRKDEDGGIELKPFGLQVKNLNRLFDVGD